MKTILDREPYPQQNRHAQWIQRGIWPSRWIGPGELKPPFVCAFRLRFTLSQPSLVRLHITADERYELYINGNRVGRGPERGDPRSWFFESYDIPFEPGNQTIVAKVWAAGPASPRSQMSLTPGFLLSPDAEELNPILATGAAPWQWKQLPGYQFVRPFPHDFFSVGYGTEVHASQLPADWQNGGGEDWNDAVFLHPGSNASQRNRFAPTVHLLTPATLPPMQERIRRQGKIRSVGRIEMDPSPISADAQLEEEVPHWQNLIDGKSTLEIPPNTSRRVIIDLENYVCAYPFLTLQGSGMCRVFWAESLFLEPEGKNKGNRNDVEGKYFTGYGDTFYPDAVSRSYESLYWRAGRYLEVRVETAEHPLRMEDFALLTTRYPLEPVSTFSCSDSRLNAIIPLGIRALQSSCHDSYMDGPYYEQMMWAGDGVQNTLTTYTLTSDDRLARKLLRLFDSSRLPSGLTAARWPARDTLVIAPYSLLWVSMVREYAFWRNDPAFVRSLLPGVRAVIDAFFGFINNDGLLELSYGWNFVDWVPGWSSGIAPDAALGVNSILNWQFIRTLGYVAELEEALGEPELAQRMRRRASELATKVSAAFWSEERGLFADDTLKKYYSEHAQAEAILSGQMTPEKQQRVVESLLKERDISRTTISYSHYLFEAFQTTGRPDAFLERLTLWHELGQRGLLTTPEGPEPTRSDCHAWGAHPIYHFFATILGIRPASVGFNTLTFRPQLGTLEWAKGSLVHPRGSIEVEVENRDGKLSGQITLPDGVSGTMFQENGETLLHPGNQSFGALT